MYIYSRDKMAREDSVEYEKKLRVRGYHVYMGRRYFRSAIDEVQARGYRATVITMWLIFVGTNFRGFNLRGCCLPTNIGLPQKFLHLRYLV